MNTSVSAAQQAVQPPTLAPREQQILSLIADGLSNQEIATQLFRSINTIEHHLKKLYRKLGVSSRTQAIREARKLGII